MIQSGPFQGSQQHVLEIKKIYEGIVNNVNLSVLKLLKRHLHQNGDTNLYNSF